MNNRFYTPDGFCDTMPGVCAFKREAEAKLRGLFSTHGYSEIETPGIEYCDVYTEPSFVKEENLYKLCDQKGRLICARYDGTVPAARFAATMLKEDEAPHRLCYIENMYRFNQTGGGRQSEFTQAGVELMGVSGSFSDAEVIALAIESALEIGIENFQISIGQVNLFAGLVKQLGIDEANVDRLRNAIADRDTVTIDMISDELQLSSEDRKTLIMVSECQGTYDVLDAFDGRINDDTAVAALKNVREILDILDDFGYLKYVTVDLGLLGGIDYYTGMIFKGFTYEVGFSIISGGRYDKTVGVFGKELQAVGFSLALSLSITAMMRQGQVFETPKADVVVGFDATVSGARGTAITYAQTLMAQGKRVILDPMGLSENELDKYADKCGIDTVIFVKEEGRS